MSINITVNGKFNRRCGKHAILDDQERVKREAEEERRRQRLKQVREESKNIAQQIRKDVSQEKERQLRNLESLRMQEMDCWRQNALGNKTQDYRTAIFQVGMAHSAAKEENRRKATKAKKPANQPTSYKAFQKQQRQSRASRQCDENQQNIANVTMPRKKAAGSMTEGKSKNAFVTDDPIADEKQTQSTAAHGVCCACQNCACCYVWCEGSEEEESTDEEEDDEDEKEEEEQEEEESNSLSTITEMEDDSWVSDLSHGSSNKSETPKKKVKSTFGLSRTPAVIVDVNVHSGDESAAMVTPHEVKDKHVQNNRQFSHVVRKSPIASKPKEKPSPPKQQPKTIKKAKMKKTSKVTNKKETVISPQTKPNTVKKPRFTQISDLVKNGAAEKNEVRPTRSRTKSRSPVKPVHSASPPRKVAPKAPPVSSKAPATAPKAPPASPRSLSPVKSSQKSSQKSPSKSSNATRSSTKASTVGKGSTRSGTSATITLQDAPAGMSRVSDSGRVQFYDHTNKFSKEYDRPANIVQAQGVSAQLEPNAMQRAAAEQRLHDSREQEAAKMRERAEERGQKAIEREQVRRDYQELTEKLDTLAQQNPQLIPGNATLNARHRYVDRAERRETQMNSVVEQLLMRPAVITCPVLTTAQKVDCSRDAIASRRSDLNLGSQPNPAANNVSSSDSCCSILLDYVNDQSEQLRSDLNTYETGSVPANQIKAERLKELLQRIEHLRDKLLAEQQSCIAKMSNGDSANNNENVQRMINSIVDLVKERDDILVDQPSEGMTNGQRASQSAADRTVGARTTQKDPESNDKIVKQSVVRPNTQQPVEIIIKVINELCKTGKRKKSKSSHTKTPRKVPVLLTPNGNSNQNGIKKINEGASNPKKKQQVVDQQNSYDSTSTSYRSLPPNLTNQMDELAAQLSTAAVGEGVETTTKRVRVSSHKTTAELNPRLAQYVQRLLGMTRSSVNALGISSSDIQTPNSSVINISGNITSSTTDANMLDEQSQERLACVQRLIEENKGFVDELKELLRAHDDAAVDITEQGLDEIWRRLLVERRVKTKLKVSTDRKPGKIKEAQSKTSTASRIVDDQVSSTSKKAESGAKALKNAPKMKNVAVEKQKTSWKEQQQPTEGRIERYEQLTTNCTQRIAELTELITRVRAEKHRLLEVTLSSVSETARNSTDYMTLPGETNKDRTEKFDGNEDDDDDESQSKLLDSDMVQKMLNLSPEEGVAPLLEKGKYTGMSRDSGIAMSRPVTSQEHHAEDPWDPCSFISTSQTEGTTSSQQQQTQPHPQQQQQQQKLPTAKVRPPATLRRFSPQLIEDEIAHELSTILEVDTPTGTGRVAAGRKETCSNSPSRSKRKEKAQRDKAMPLPFPTFEQYMQKINVDLSNVDPEQSVRIEQEFNELMTALQDTGDDNALNYIEFPSMTAYLQNLKDQSSGPPSSKCSCTDSIEDLLACLRLANLTVKSFPNRKEYMRRLAETDSYAEDPPENSHERSTGSDTETTESTLNIQAELERRNILKQGESGSGRAQQNKILNSTVRSRSDECERLNAQLFASESGIDKLNSTTPYSASGGVSSSVSRGNKNVQWDQIQQQNQEMHSLTSSSYSIQFTQQQQQRQPPASNKREMNARPLSLRDFLTKELLKHVSTSCSSSGYTDDTLRSNFMHSVINSLMSPSSTSPIPGEMPYGNNAKTLGVGARQTSTPVNVCPCTERECQYERNVRYGPDSNSSGSSSSNPTIFHYCCVQQKQRKGRVSPVRVQQQDQVSPECVQQQQGRSSPVHVQQRQGRISPVYAQQQGRISPVHVQQQQQQQPCRSSPVHVQQQQQQQQQERISPVYAQQQGRISPVHVQQQQQGRTSPVHVQQQQQGRTSPVHVQQQQQQGCVPLSSHMQYQQGFH